MMPPIIHAHVSAEQLGDGRLLVVGDVHGCRDELQMLLAKINYTDSDNIILAGDLVDKGPYPIEVSTPSWFPATRCSLVLTAAWAEHLRLLADYCGGEAVGRTISEGQSR